MKVRKQAVARKTNSAYVPVGVGFIAAQPSPELLAELDKERKRQIAERVKELREDSPYTQEAIADRLGITVRAYQKQEKTGGISYDNIEKLAELHGVETDWILKGDKPATPDLLGANTGESQLDRIERRLDDIVARLDSMTEVADEFVSQQSARRVSEAVGAAAAKPPRKPSASPRKRRATQKP